MRTSSRLRLRPAPFVLGVAAGAALTASPLSAQRPDPALLAFESGPAGAVPAGWSANGGHVAADSLDAHGGRYAVRLDNEAAGMGAVLMLQFPVDFGGESITLSGWLRTEDVEGFAGLWLRQDGSGGTLAFDNMQSQGLRGATPWRRYSVTLPLHARAERLVLGALLAGTGTTWVDDLEITVDGRPLAEAPERVVPPDSVTMDEEFDGGSRIDVRSATPVQVENLALLARVWGFVKYHHPRVAGGGLNWDYELFRVMPEVLAASDRAAAQTALVAWMARVGRPVPCAPCAPAPPAGAHLKPDLRWIADPELLGSALSDRLVEIHRNRWTGERQRFIGRISGVGNPDLADEAGYPDPPLPDAGYRLLALFRFWNVIEYWFPYRDVIDGPWAAVLAEFVPRMLAADDVDAYRLAMIDLSARITDTHANVWQHLAVRPPVGNAALPVVFRFVEDHAVVAGWAHEEHGPATGLRRGDVIETIDGAPVDSLVAAWAPHYSASNPPTRLRDIARGLGRGPEGPVRLGVVREGERTEVIARRVPQAELDARAGRTHDLPGEAFQRLDQDVAYLKLSSVVAADVPLYLEQAAGSRVLVIDIRNYPSEFVPFALGGHLTADTVPFAKFTTGDLSNPGAFDWTPEVRIAPLAPRWEGKVVVLVDEVSQSQAEYTSMAFRAAGATIVGSTTAGADGNVSPIPLPGGIQSMISGIGVFYPDGTPTQRIGIVPDVEVRPTIAGIRNGRDEVLEAAVAHALGRAWRPGG